VLLTKAQYIKSSYVINDLPIDLDKLLGLKNVLLLEAENCFSGAEPNTNVWPDKGYTFVKL